ncbi:hypothetical protein JW930_03420 [Candidatus Woesearchaeota archaeon]|nr:hypothetical protein [Candidatus Woesearchaeota archaeon]
MDNPIFSEINKLLKLGKKEEVQEEVNYIKDLRKFEAQSLENYPRLEVRYKVYPSSFGVRFLESPQETPNMPINEGIIPIISKTPKIKSLVNQLRYDAKKSEITKYERIKKQSELIMRHRNNGMSEQDLQEFIQIFPAEFDINISCVPFNISAGPDITADVKIYTNNINSVIELDKQLNHFKEKALNEILQERIDNSKRELDQLR